MIGVCFFHEDFDSDVSSGTTFAIEQWNNLFVAFGIKKVAIINLTEETLPSLCNSINLQEFKTLQEFTDRAKGVVVTSSPKGKQHYKNMNYKDIDWIIIGGTGGSGDHLGINIPTRNNRELYPREAAAIIVAEASWQLV